MPPTIESDPTWTHAPTDGGHGVGGPLDPMSFFLGALGERVSKHAQDRCSASSPLSVRSAVIGRPADCPIQTYG